jgi:uncharacterized protein (DUF1684 family)
MTLDPATAHADWCRQRREHLLGPDSPVGWVGLLWLTPGDTDIGPEAGLPETVGELRWQGAETLWRSAVAGVTVDGQPAPVGAWLPLRSDAAGQPSRLRHGDHEAFLIEREGKLALRVKDLAWLAAWPAAPRLEGATYDPAWRLSACWEQLAEPIHIEIPTVTGDLKPVTLTGQLRFTALGDSAERVLLPMQVDADGIFLVFRDAGSGKFGYGAGRFLRLPVAGELLEGTPLILDFNYAYNPPCAFTVFAACPLPPPENWLPFAVPAGEKKWSKAG